MIYQFLARAVTQAHNQNPPQMVDLSAYYSNIGLLETALTRNTEIVEIKGEIEKLDNVSKIYFRPVYKFFQDDLTHFINLGFVFLNFVIKADSYNSYTNSFGAHNDNQHISTYMQSKDTLNLLIPFELIATAKKSLIPINIQSAFIQNPYHSCFKYALSPSPVVAVVINGDMNNLVPYIVHTDLLEKALNQDTSETKKEFLRYDTKLALDVLKLTYGVYVNVQVVEKLAKMEKDMLMDNNKHGVTIIEMSNINW